MRGESLLRRHDKTIVAGKRIAEIKLPFNKDVGANHQKKVWISPLILPFQRLGKKSEAMPGPLSFILTIP